MMKKRIVAAIAAACAAATLLGACGGSSSDASSDHIISAYNSEPQNPLIPGNSNESGGLRIITELFSNLVVFDPAGKAHNEVAQSITPNANSTEYTIVLKPWKFSDGTPVTASSFTKAWSYVANAKNAQKNSSFMAPIAGYDDLQDAKSLKGDEQLKGLKVVDDHTFTVQLKAPDSVFPIKIGYAAYAPLPESFYKDPKAFGEKPVGNGPYKFESWTHNVDVKIVKNPDYKGYLTVKNDGITFKNYTNDAAAYADIQAGNLDVMDTVPSADTKTFTTDTSLQAYNKPGVVNQTITIPSDLEHFKNGTEEGTLRRQALSMAINRQEICDKIFNGTATPALDFTSPKIDGYSANLKGVDNVKFNAEKARELWAKAEKISHFDGKFTIAYNADGGTKSMFDALVNSVKNTLHINIETNPVPTFQEFRDDIDKHTLKGAYRNGWQPDYPSAENYLFQVYASASADGNGSNDGGYKNPAFDALLAQAAQTPDIAQANKLYGQAQELLLNDLPSIPLYNSNAKGVAAKNIRGFVMNWQDEPEYELLEK